MYKLELVDVCKNHWNIKLFCMISLTLPWFLKGGQLHWLACNEGGGGATFWTFSCISRRNSLKFKRYDSQGKKFGWKNAELIIQLPEIQKICHVQALIPKRHFLTWWSGTDP